MLLLVAKGETRKALWTHRIHKVLVLFFIEFKNSTNNSTELLKTVDTEGSITIWT